MEATGRGLLGTIPSPLWALSPPLPHPQAEASWCPLKIVETWSPWSWCGPSAEAIPPTPPWWVCLRCRPPPSLGGSGPCLAPGAYRIESGLQSAMGVRVPSAAEGREVLAQPWVGQTCKAPSLGRQRLGLLGIYLLMQKSNMCSF